MRATIHHLTEYRYPEPAWDSFNELRLEPTGDDRQTVLSYHLTVTPDAVVERRHDPFGTPVQHVHIRAPHELLRFETRSVVVTHPVREPPPAPLAALAPLRAQWLDYVGASARVPADLDWPATFGCAIPQDADDLVAYLDGLTRHLHARFTYAPGATGVNTPLAEFALSGRGVCQDYAHAMIAVCRAAGIPTRYVSGYVYAGADFVGAEATHAWVEALVPGHGWLGLDPTNNVRVNEAHVKIGHGRDYDDVPPVRGVRRGGGRERLGVEVSFAADGP